MSLRVSRHKSNILRAYSWPQIGIAQMDSRSADLHMKQPMAASLSMAFGAGFIDTAVTARAAGWSLSTSIPDTWHDYACSARGDELGSSNNDCMYDLTKCSSL